MLCPLCNTQNRENARYCKGCGKDLAALVSEQQEQTQPAPAADQAGPAEAIEVTIPVDQAAVPPPAEAAEETTQVAENDDISMAPTQILTPDKMVAYQIKRWKEEPEKETQDAEERRRQAIADAPTLLFPLANLVQEKQEEPDIASQPTRAMALNTETPTRVPTEPGPEAADSATPASQEQARPASVQTAEASAPDKNQQHTAEADSQQAAAADEAVAPTAQEEEHMEQEQDMPVTEGEEQQQPESQEEIQPVTFPVQAEGTLIAGRYEIAQVVSESENEHTYQVTDQQGYKHCWNCNSEQNAEGDEFCIDCGAELNSATYTMHEYNSAEAPSNETSVLQGTVINTFVDQEHTYVVEQPQATQNAFPNGIHLIAACDSDAGDVRRSEPNEDSTLVLNIQRVHESISAPAGVFLVADGMGGHDKGQVASRMTVNVIAQKILQDLLAPPLAEEQAGGQQERSADSYKSLLRTTVEEANTALCQANQSNKSDMGSTLTGFMIAGDFAYIFNVGDSRTYMLREGNLYQLTNDHSLVGQLVAGGLIEPDDVYTHPQRNQIYRSIGDKLNVQIDIFEQQIHPGDILLSCSDGLWEMVRNPQIAALLSSAPDPHTASAQLIEAANTNGGEDNISAVVVFVR